MHRELSDHDYTVLLTVCAVDIYPETICEVNLPDGLPDSDSKNSPFLIPKNKLTTTLELTGNRQEENKKIKAKFLPANLQYTDSLLLPITVILFLASQLLESYIFVIDMDVHMDRDIDADVHQHDGSSEEAEHENKTISPATTAKRKLKESKRNAQNYCKPCF